MFFGHDLAILIAVVISSFVILCIFSRDNCGR